MKKYQNLADISIHVWHNKYKYLVPGIHLRDGSRGARIRVQLDPMYSYCCCALTLLVDG